MTPEQKNVPNQQSNEELMQLYQKGEEYAFEILYWRHQQGVFNFICHFTGESRGRAEELLQDVFLKIIKSSKRYKPTAKFTTWLYQIARNGCIDHLRKMKHRKNTSLNQPVNHEEEMVVESTLTSDNPSPERSAHLSEIAQTIKKAIHTLPEEQREVFLLREDLDLSFAQIADLIGCPINTAKSRMRYALEHLRKRIALEGVTPYEAKEDEMPSM